MTTKPQISSKSIDLVRNALLVAGNEMGAEGDHWPVINATIHNVMKDYEEYVIENNVSAEVSKHFSAIIDDLEKNLHLCPSDLRPEAHKMITELRDLHAASSTPVDITAVASDKAEWPMHIKRADTIIKTLGE